MHVDPTNEQFAAFKSMDRQQPINMLNLVQLKPQASYADGRAATGAEAYETYGAKSSPIFQRVGGKIVWRGVPNAALIGPMEELWHIAFIARYPTLGAFLEMVTDPQYQAIVFHRQAAVADSRLIPIHDAPGGASFG
ncbi:MAG: DUF1330 domain-containing protein [Pseudomonadota bacterium]